jgi:pyridoxal phosphate enzyme (YggS family)
VLNEEPMPSIKENYELVMENIERSTAVSGRKEKVSLVAATKTVSHDKIIEAVKAGVKIIGENRVAEAVEKFKQVKENVVWHMIGHLQRNKVKHALQIFDMIQSIDKIETALEIEKRAVKPIDILIEINSSGEETKSGVKPDQLFTLVDQLKKLTKIKIKGVMTIGPFTTDEKRIRKAFTATRQKFEELAGIEKDPEIKYLSMGMSFDYRIAIEEGSNMVRVGSAIFGRRPSA